MDDRFSRETLDLRDRFYDSLKEFGGRSKQSQQGADDVNPVLKREFYKILDRVSYHLTEDRENFYGYFFFQMGREIRLDLAGPTGVNFKGAGYVLYFNPLFFLELDREQMQSMIKHEILHVLSGHLIRAVGLRKHLSRPAVNMGMDIVVNSLLSPLPPYAVTLRSVNSRYFLNMMPYETFEAYADKIQTAMDLLDEFKETPDEVNEDEALGQTEFSPDTTHDIWEESTDADEEVMLEMARKAADQAIKGELPTYIHTLLEGLKDSRGELPWNLYLNRLMGRVESQRKRTVTRRDRRQPERLDLRGQLRVHKAKIMVGIDISASISEGEFRQAMVEVFAIVKNYNHEITVVECDDEIRRIYPVRKEQELKARLDLRGATRFTPVFEYANHERINLLIYFTDGKGEKHLPVIPKGYKVLWIISGNGDKLSLENPYGAVKKLSAVAVKEKSEETAEVDKGGYSMNHHESMF